ncbi:MAG TPA: amidase family protein, partial [Albitalea sp.]|nr:amidase family protein [Albitalea sp.]
PLDLALHAGHAAATDPPRDLRIAWSARLGGDHAIDADVLAVLQRSVDALRAAGWTVVDDDPAWPAGLGDDPLAPLQHAALHALHGHHGEDRRDDIDPALRAQIDAGAACTPLQRSALLALRRRIDASLSRFFDRHDLLLCPTAPVTAWPIDQAWPCVIEGRRAGPRGHAAFTPLFNVCGVPACSVPAGTVRGLPVGLQIVAPRFEDARVLQMAALLERLVAARTW